MTTFVGEGLALPEGPLFLDDGTLVVTEMAPDRGCVTRIAADGTLGAVIAKTGRPNGLAPAPDSCIWVAESLQPAVLWLDLEGRTEIIATRCADLPLLWPNDLCVGPDGRLYVSDSGILFTSFMEAEVSGVDVLSLELDGRVLAIDPQTGAGEIIDRGLQFTNGIAFGPDGLLYVTETITGNVYRYDVGGSATRELFGNVLDTSSPIQGIGGPDGIAFDADGNLYVTVYGQRNVTILGTSGTVTRRIPIRGLSPTNVAFGPSGSTQIYVTDCEHGCVEVIDVGSRGLQLRR